MMVIVAVVLPFLLGLVTITEVRTALGRSRSKEPKKGGSKTGNEKDGAKKAGIIHRLSDMKFFGKPEGADQKRPPKTEKKEAGKTPGQEGGIGAHFSSFLSSIGSLGTVLRQRKRHEKKVDDINRMLDKAVTEKSRSRPLPPRVVPGAPGGGGGAAVPGPSGETDPFLSLSSDEFDAGLLDDLGDVNAPLHPLKVLRPVKLLPLPHPVLNCRCHRLTCRTGAGGRPGHLLREAWKSSVVWTRQNRSILNWGTR